MTTDPASEAPVVDKNARQSQLEVEYDDFGLPIRKPKPKAPAEDSSDEEFQDAVASKPPSKDHAALPEPGANGAEKLDEEEDLEQQHGEAGAPAVNGHKKEEAPDGHEDTKTEHKEDERRPAATEKPAESTKPSPKTHKRNFSGSAHGHQPPSYSEYSHQQLAPQKPAAGDDEEDDGGWQTMPAYARYDIYDDDNKLIAKENEEELMDMNGYGNLGGAAKGYTRVIMDEDVESQTSMDDNTAYLFKEKGNTVYEEDEAARDPLAQMQTTKGLLTEGQRIAYVGLVRLAMVEMYKNITELERTKGTKKNLDVAQETTQKWSQKMMVRLYSHMDVDPAEQIMIEQLQEHGVVPADLTPALMQNARVKNPAAEDPGDGSDSESASVSSRRPSSHEKFETLKAEKGKSTSSSTLDDTIASAPPPPYEEHEGEDLPQARTPSQLPETQNIDIDLRWTVLCDLFLVLIADSVYDSRSRQLLEYVGKYLSVDWLEICRFEKRVTDALEMQEEAQKENWNEDEHMETRRKRARNRRLALMGLATVGGGLVIGLSAGLLAPVIGPGLALGFSTIGVAGTSGFLAGAGGAAIITTTGVVSGGTIAVRAANRRTATVKTFEYRPLHNNKRVNLILTIGGWLTGKVDDVRLPFSTVDPIMGDLYSVLWEPEILRSMGDTINILATEALTQGLQHVLGTTILVALMAAIQLPVGLTKLSYLIDNPWSVSLARGDMAGLILADSLIDRNLGTRPVTLVGFSLGARVIYSCLKELVKRDAYGIVQNVYMFGTPVVVKKDEYIRARALVPGRFVNGYASNDWILSYLFRATGGGIMQVAGLAPIEIPGIENINCTELVPGHMSYRAAMPKLLREVGWAVESDEFTEIEDPDPDNHEKRQRELINEIEEARRKLEEEEKQKNKRSFSFWRKKKTAKKDWEVYDENSVRERAGKQGDATAGGTEGPVLFDIDAIRAEVVALSSEGIEIKEIKSTLPPMKIDIGATPPNPPYSNLRETKSYNDSLDVAPSSNIGGSTSNLSIQSSYSRQSNHSANDQASKKKSLEEYDEEADTEGMTMTFDVSFRDPPSASSGALVPSYEPSKATTWETPTATERPPLKSANTEPNLNITPGYNAWTDEYEDDFGKEQEMKMTFE